jgi:hypothetical protein
MAATMRSLGRTLTVMGCLFAVVSVVVLTSAGPRQDPSDIVPIPIGFVLQVVSSALGGLVIAFVGCCLESWGSYLSKRITP